MADRTIYKYFLVGGADNAFFAHMPAEAQVLSAGFQETRFVVWAIVNPEHPTRTHRFHVAGTGHPLGKDARADNLLNRVEIERNVGTPLIFHVFDLGEGS